MEKLTIMSARSLQYYVIAKRWASDLEFYKVETAFLQHLLDEYFTRLCQPDMLNELKEVGKELTALEDDEQQAEVQLTKQIKQLELVAEEVVHEDTEELATAQVQLEYTIMNLNRQYREVKQKLFALVENVLHDFKLISG